MCVQVDAWLARDSGTMATLCTRPLCTVPLPLITDQRLHTWGKKRRPGLGSAELRIALDCCQVCIVRQRGARDEGALRQLHAAARHKPLAIAESADAS